MKALLLATTVASLALATTANAASFTFGNLIIAQIAHGKSHNVRQPSHRTNGVLGKFDGVRIGLLRGDPDFRATAALRTAPSSLAATPGWRHE